MKLADMIVSAVLKRGVVWEARNFTTTVYIPENNITLEIRADHMTVKTEKEKE